MGGTALGARKTLRREIADLTFRRPGVCLRDGYFCARYMQEGLALDAEAALLKQLSYLVAEQHAALLVNSHASAASLLGADMASRSEMNPHPRAKLALPAPTSVIHPPCSPAGLCLVPMFP